MRSRKPVLIVLALGLLLSLAAGPALAAPLGPVNVSAFGTNGVLFSVEPPGGGAFQVRASVELAREADRSRQVWLAGLAWDLEAPGAVAVRWLQGGGWLPVWRLQLAAPEGVLPEGYVDGREGGFAYVDFNVTTSRLGSYDVALAYDAASERLSLRVVDRANGAELAAATFAGVRLQGGLRPVSGLFGAVAGLNVAQLEYLEGFAEYGPDLGIKRGFAWKLLADGAEISRSQFEFFDTTPMSALFQWPSTPVPGEVRLSVVQGGRAVPLLTLPWSAEPVSLSLPPLRELPPGESALRLEYHSGGATHLLDERPLRILRNKLHVTFSTYGRNARRDPSEPTLPLDPYPPLYGTVRVWGELPLDGLKMQLVATYTPGASRLDTGRVDQGRSASFVLFEKELYAGAGEVLEIPFSFHPPQDAGRVTLDLRPAPGAGVVYVSSLNASTPVVAVPIVPAFPGAEGWGMYATGGRGGRVFRVTNLNDSGPGSLREAIEAEGPRIVVFDVSGTIELKSPLRVTNPHLTIAGQTAPGDGITLKNYALLIQADHVVVRFIRVRPGDGARTEMDAVEIRDAEHVILDHVTLSWGVDEIFNNWHNGRNHTLQWSMVYEALHNSVHPKGAHGFAMSVGGEGLSLHHTLIANSPGRNPSLAGAVRMDFRNNVIYNWLHRSGDGGVSSINMVNNYYKAGPATQPNLRNRIVEVESPTGRYYVAGNYVDGYPQVTEDNWNGGVHQEGSFDLSIVRAASPVRVPPVLTHSATEAYELVLQYSGAILPRRDEADERVVREVRTGAPERTQFGIVNAPDEVGGYPVLASAPAPADTDGDGMPDEWELERGLDPEDPSDGTADPDGDGYTHLEEYLNGLAESAYPPGHLEVWYERYGR